MSDELEKTKKQSWLRGRVRRRQFWGFHIVNFVLLFFLGVLRLGEIDILQYIPAIYVLLMLKPFISYTVKRLHDIGLSGYYLFLWFIPWSIGLLGELCDRHKTQHQIQDVAAVIAIVLAVVFFIAFCCDSTPGENKYGPNPKGVGKDAPPTITRVILKKLWECTGGKVKVIMTRPKFTKKHLISFYTLEGASVSIAPSQVVSIQQSENNAWMIVMTSGQSFKVNEETKQLVLTAIS